MGCRDLPVWGCAALTQNASIGRSFLPPPPPTLNSKTCLGTVSLPVSSAPETIPLGRPPRLSAVLPLRPLRQAARSSV